MTKGKKKTGFSLLKKFVLTALIVLFILAGISAYFIYSFVFSHNVTIDDRDTEFLYIPTGSNYSDVLNILNENSFISNTKSFEWVAEQKNYPNHVHAGRYLLRNGMSNNELINMLRSGSQHPINLIISNNRTKEQLAGHISKRIEADSLSIIKLLNDKELIESYGLTIESAILLFIPDTYQFLWNTSAEQLLKRKNREYQRFWNEERLNKAKAMQLSPVEVGILASIVQQETTRPDEMNKIAGVYINRLQKRMPLQADPTIIFAHGDFTITRVLNRHLEIDSPYNTYKNRGLPPGPISLPTPAAIESVLNFQKHDYLYFCAREDFSGYHSFARTYQQHLINARKYQQELNRRNIMK